MVIAFNFKPSEMIFPESGYKGLVAFNIYLFAMIFLMVYLLWGDACSDMGESWEGFGPPDGFGFIYLKINSNIKIT